MDGLLCLLVVTSTIALTKLLVLKILKYQNFN